VGLIIGPVGLYIRANVHEPPAIERELHREAAPLRVLFTRHWAAVLRTVGLIALGTMSTYVLELNMPTYAQRELGIPVGDTFLSNVVADVVAIVVAIWAGHLSDRHGPRAVMLPAAIALGLAVFPSFVLLTMFPATVTLIVLQTILLALLAMMTGPIYGLLGSLFPPQVRVSGLSVGYSLSVMIFGGFASFITTGLIALTGDRHMPGLYVTAGAVLTTLALTVGWPWGQREPPHPAALANEPG
jgi:MHS family proline/betaine transporter-like MFS transporter